MATLKIDLTELNGINGITLNGPKKSEKKSSAIATGDINGDGLTDVLVSTFEDKEKGKDKANSSYVLYGSTEGFTPIIDLTDFDGSNGFSILGPEKSQKSPMDIATGDLNGDGIADMILGAVETKDKGGKDKNDDTSTYVVFGNSAGFGPQIDLEGIDGSNGFVLTGPKQSDKKRSSIATGDLNGDGIDDLIVSAFNIEEDKGKDKDKEKRKDKPNATYVVFGASEGFDATIDFTSLDGSNGFTILGLEKSEKNSLAVETGDINGDGIEDLILGAFESKGKGKDKESSSYVLFGSESGFAPTIDLEEIDGSNGIVMTAPKKKSDKSLNSIGTGDVNGDGVEDVILGGFEKSSKEKTASTYVVFGGETLASEIDLTALNGSDGILINGPDKSDKASVAVSSGDINTDGIDDILVGVFEGDKKGKDKGSVSYVVYGSQDGLGPVIDLANLDEGIILEGPKTKKSYSSEDIAVGDVNGDGSDDIVIGAFEVKDKETDTDSSTYVVFGGDISGDIVDDDDEDDDEVDGDDEDDDDGVDGDDEDDDDEVDGDDEDEDEDEDDDDDEGDDDGDFDFDFDFINSFSTIEISDFDVVTGSIELNSTFLSFLNVTSSTEIVQTIVTSSTTSIESSSNLLVFTDLTDMDAIQEQLVALGVNSTLFLYTNAEGISELGFFFQSEEQTIINQVVEFSSNIDLESFSIDNLSFIEDETDDDDDSDDDDSDDDDSDDDDSDDDDSDDDDSDDDDSDDDDSDDDDSDDDDSDDDEPEEIGGTDGDDELVGTPESDVINGFEGNDTISGLDSRDILRGGQGDDLINGDGGNDYIVGNSGNDTLIGGDGSDLMLGVTGDDLMQGEGGADHLLGGDGDDTLEGGDGDDRLNGNAGDDILTGGAGRDRFIFNTNEPFTTESVGVDEIADFSQEDGDLILLDARTFSVLESENGIGFSVIAEFAAVTSDADAEIAEAFIVYNSESGGLFYNENGSEAGFGSGGQFATLTGVPELSAESFQVRDPVV